MSRHLAVSRPHFTPTRGASVLVYVVLLAAAMLEKFGQTTHDTKTPLIVTPGRFLREAGHLWNPDTSLGEIQNQAYGYFFPQGPFYLLAELAHVPPWVSERFWSVLLLVVGCEGARLLGKSMGLGAWPAWVAGMAYGLTPRVLSQVATRSAEVLPAAVLPWVVLPIVLAMTGRLGVRRAALFSAAAFAFSGGINGTATAAPMLLVLVVLVWGVRTDRASRALLGWWVALVSVTSVWWVASLLRLNAYSPPFFDYVEDTAATTGPTGYASSLRGTSNWVNYIYTGSFPTWPAGAQLAGDPWLVLMGSLVAAAGVLGLARWASPWRAPMLISASIALACLTVGHTWPLGSLVGGGVRELLDGPLALLRNVSKIDPPLRLPLALGVGVTFASAVRWSARLRPRWQWVAPGVLVGLVLALAQPALALNLRTEGWEEVPDHWQQAADFLADQPGGDDLTTWVVPGSGFGVQTWGWTQDEPMAAVATTPWFSRSQVPLVPPETIRVLSRLEGFLDTGAGSPNLGVALGRLGVGHVLVRHDLDQTLSEATSSNLVSIALARSPNLERVAQFGALEFGPAIELYAVLSEVADEFSVRPVDGVVTVAGASTDVIEAIGAGLVGEGEPAIVQGDDGWDRPADIVGDTYRDRERDFGRVHDAEGPVLAEGEPRHSTRKVGNYPANSGAQPLVATYDDILYADASSSQAFVQTNSAVLPETAPYSAVDGDPFTGWRTEYYDDPNGQWLEVRFREERPIGQVGLLSSISDNVLDEVTNWRISAGGVQEDVEVDRLTGWARGDLDGVMADSIRFTVTGIEVREGFTVGAISLLEVEMDGLPSGRTLVVPPADVADDADYLFTTQPETRACIPTLLGPDCRFDRRRQAEESVGIDRTVTIPAKGRWGIEGTVIARPRAATAALLDPLSDRMRVSASSALGSDPSVSARMSYDGDTATSWIADPFDPDPTLTVEFDRPRRVKEIDVVPPAYSAAIPTEAIIRGGGQTRTVDLGGLGRFEPIVTQRLTISFKNPTRGLAPLGISELYLQPGGRSVPLRGGSPTGSVCGLGPVLEVDGVKHLTRVEGVMGNIASAGPLSIVPCLWDTLVLRAGEHRIRILSTEQFQPAVAILRHRDTPARVTPDDRDLEVVTDEDTHQVLTVSAGEESLLGTTRNSNGGWVATLNGAQLPVQQVDGWAQGWLIPAGEGGVIDIVYAPERSYVVVLVAGLGVTGLALLLALVLLVRTRLEPGGPLEADPPRPASSRGRAGAVVLIAAVVGWAVGGLPVLIALVLAVVLRGIGVAALPVAAALLVGGAVSSAVAAADQPGLRDLADALAGSGFVLVVVLAATASNRRPVT